MTNCQYCGGKRKLPLNSRHGLPICSKCKKKDEKEEVKDEALLNKLKKFLRYLRDSESIDHDTYLDLSAMEQNYGIDGCDVDYVLQYCAENCPKHLSDYFWKFEELSS